jgi:hypothetical protein
MKLAHTFDDGSSVDVDVTGVLVFLGSAILFLPFLFVFGFTTPTWTLMAVAVVGFLHFWICLFSAIWSNVREEEKKERSKKIPGE